MRVLTRADAPTPAERQAQIDAWNAAYVPSFQVGDCVYPPYEPQKAGRIVAVELCQNRPDTLKFANYTVRLPNGTIWKSQIVTPFQKLIDDHERKLATHRARMAQIQAIPLEGGAS